MVAEFFHAEKMTNPQWGDCIKKWPIHFWKGMAIGLFCLMFALPFVASIIQDRLGPPTTISQSISPASVPAQVDGVLVMQVTAARGRTCQGQISRYLWRWDTTPKGDKIRNYFPLFSPLVPLSDPAREGVFRLSLQIPDTITPGQYYYTARLSTWCGVWGTLFGDDTTFASADIPVTIHPRNTK